MVSRRRLFLGLRMAVSVLMLAYLLSRLDLSSLVPPGNRATLFWLVAGLVALFAAIVLSALRWQRILRALELPADLAPLVSHSLAALFVANFLPSTIGGDVLRVVRLSAANGERPASFASVVLERLTGFVVLPLITLVALVVHPSLLHLGTATRVALVLSFLSLAALAAVVSAAASPRLGGRLAGHESWLRFVGAVHVGLERIRRRPSAAASALLVALAYQLTVVLSAWIATRVVGIHIGWFPVMAFIPVVAIAQVIPVSVNGLGLREGALVLLLAPLGVADGKAVALGLLLYAMNVAVSLLGAPAFAIGGRRREALA